MFTERRRPHRVAGLLKIEISEIIKTKVKDPRIGFVTITDVVLSQDLKHAKVFVSMLGDETSQKGTMAALEKAKAFIQRELGGRVRLRYLPILRFVKDESWQQGVKIEQILHDLHLEEQDLNEEAG